jgi:hypothetical protein
MKPIIFCSWLVGVVSSCNVIDVFG